MKNTLFFLFSILFFGIAYTQNSTKWFVEGAQWRYNYIGLGGTGVATYSMLSDTIIQGKSCKHLVFDFKGVQGQQGTGKRHQYAYAQKDSVFIFQGTEFVLLYDFTASVGDTLKQATFGFYTHFIIDSLGMTPLFGLNLKTQYGRLINPSNPLGEQAVTVYERIGGPVFDMLEQGTAMIEIIHYLECYRDDEVPFQLCNTALEIDYQPFRHQATYSENDGIWYTNNIFQYQIKGDTVIAEGVGLKVYAKHSYQSTWGPTNTSEVIHEPYAFIGILGQDILHKKVYFKHVQHWPEPITSVLSGLPADSFYVLYDFDLKTPWLDTVPSKPTNNIFALQDSIQLENGMYRKRYYFGNQDDLVIDSSMYWIEGIGGNLGLFTGRMLSFVWDVSHSLRCIHKYGIPLILNVDASKCEVPTLIKTLENNNTKTFVVQPNPARNYCDIQIDIEDVLKEEVFIELVDLTGRIVLKQIMQDVDSQRLVLFNVPTGVYLLRLRSGGRLIGVQKLLVQR